jgi:drug/metabolite transporter (DMT)-like permease
MKLIGIVLIVVGVVALAMGGFSYTTREKVLDLGPIQATAEKNHTVPLSPIVGIAALIGGIAVLAAGSRTRA